MCQCRIKKLCEKLSFDIFYVCLVHHNIALKLQVKKLYNLCVNVFCPFSYFWNICACMYYFSYRPYVDPRNWCYVTPWGYSALNYTYICANILVQKVCKISCLTLGLVRKWYARFKPLVLSKGLRGVVYS